jgi:hypothetical protein
MIGGASIGPQESMTFGRVQCLRERPILGHQPDLRLFTPPPNHPARGM